MKTLKTFILGLALLAICGVAQAKNKDDDKLTSNYAINTYINAMTYGIVQGLNDVLDKTAEFSLLMGNRVISCDKKEILNYFEMNKDIEQGCATTTSFIEKNDNMVIVKVDMKYSTFLRSNYVIVANTSKGWKITHVYSTFK